jgi:hypothetical protein
MDGLAFFHFPVQNWHRRAGMLPSCFLYIVFSLAADIFIDMSFFIVQGEDYIEKT